MSRRAIHKAFFESAGLVGASVLQVYLLRRLFERKLGMSRVWPCYSHPWDFALNYPIVEFYTLLAITCFCLVLFSSKNKSCIETASLEIQIQSLVSCGRLSEILEFLSDMWEFLNTSDPNLFVFLPDYSCVQRLRTYIFQPYITGYSSLFLLFIISSIMSLGCYELLRASILVLESQILNAQGIW